MWRWGGDAVDGGDAGDAGDAGDGCLHVSIVRFLVNPSFDPLDHSLLLPSAEHGTHPSFRYFEAPHANGGIPHHSRAQASVG